MAESTSVETQAVANTRHALELVAQLLEQGVEEAVISPGSRNTPLVFALDAYARLGRMKLHVVVDERVAGFVALGAARVSGKPVALTCTSGSAAAHYLPAVMEAQRAKLSLIVLSADRPEELQHRGAPQTTDQTQLFTPFVIETLQLAAVAPSLDLSHATAQAVQRAIAGARAAKAPLHINVAFREPLWSPDCQALLTNPPPARALRIFESEARPGIAGLEALRSLQGQGLIYVGPIDAGALSTQERHALQDAVLATAERLDWVVAADAVSPLRRAGSAVVQHMDVLLRSDRFLHQDNLDHVVVLGPWPTSKPFGQWLTRQPKLQVTSLPGAIGPIDPWHRVNLSVGGDLLECIQALGVAHSSTKTGLRDAVLQLDQAIDTTLEDFCATHPTFEGNIARTVLATVAGDLSLHIGSSMPIRDVDTYSAGAQAGVLLCASRGVNGIDGNISTALGAALSSQKPAVLLLGDIAFRHDLGGLAQAANHHAALTIIVVDNAGGGIFRHLAVAQSGEGFSPYFLTPQQTQIGALAEGTGAHVHRLDDASSLADTLREVVTLPRVDVIWLPVPGEQQVPSRTEAVKQATQAAEQVLRTLPSLTPTAKESR